MELDILEEVNKSEAETNSTIPNSSTSREDNELPCSDILKFDSSDSNVKLTQEKSRERANQEDLDINLCSDVEIEKAGDKTEIQSSNIPIQESCLAQGSDVNESENTMNSKDKKVNVDFSETDDQTLDKLGEVNESELAQPKSVTQSLYHIKWFKWKGLNTALIMQNENGPCPLLAIINLLILSRKISIPPMQEFITDGQLMEYLGDCILEHAPKKLSEGAQLNYEQNMHDAIGIMCKLQTGLDVNVKFTGVADFEFTPECIVFDLLNIGLYHGWLVDPQEVEETRAVSKLSYNQLVEKIIVSKQQPDNSQQVSEGLIAEAFLERTASQLTYHGLCELNGHLKDDELCVFFRNNHFSTMYKHRSELFLLVTDQGFLTEEQVIWATLSNVEGDCVFVDANFRTSLASRTPPPPPLPEQSACATDKPMTGISQEDQDYLVALSLQEEQNQSSHQEDSSKPNTESTSTSPTEQTDPDAHQEWTDLQLAMQLQEEEQRLQQQQARMAQRRQDAPHQPFQSMASGRPVPRSTPQPSQENPPRTSGERCVIL